MTREPRYFLPELIRATCEAWVRAEAAFEGVSEIVTPQLIGLEPGQEAPINKDLHVRAFPVVHRVPSLGYTLLSSKRKLKAEYAGTPGAELARLRRENVEIQETLVELEITFIGDCIGKSLFDEAHIWDSTVLLLEATFLAPGEEELAVQKGHTHLHEIAAALEHFGERVRCRHIVLKHFSMRYRAEEIRAHVERVIPPAFRERIALLI